MVPWRRLNFSSHPWLAFSERISPEIQCRRSFAVLLDKPQVGGFLYVLVRRFPQCLPLLHSFSYSMVDWDGRKNFLLVLLDIWDGGFSAVELLNQYWGLVPRSRLSVISFFTCKVRTSRFLFFTLSLPYSRTLRLQLLLPHSIVFITFYIMHCTTRKRSDVRIIEVRIKEVGLYLCRDANVGRCMVL